MANKDFNILLAEDEHNNPCDFNKLVSTMEHNYLADTSSVYLDPRGPVSVTNPDSVNNLDEHEPNNFKTETLIYPNDCTFLTESVGKDSTKADEVKRSSTRKSSRKITSSNQKSEKTGTKLPARKSRRNSGKMLMLDLLSADVRRQQRSEMARKARPSSWGLGGIIDEIFNKNSEMFVDSYENIKSRKSKSGHKRGDRNTDSVNQSIQGENRSLNNGLLLKLKLGTKPILNCQINTIPDMDKDLESFRDVEIENHVKEVSRVSNDSLVPSESFLFDTFVAEKEKSQDLTSKIHEITELVEPVENRCSDPGTSPDSEVINVIPDAQISGNTAEEIKISSKDCISNQLVDCDVLSCEKEIERAWSTGAFMSIPNPVSSRNISSREECPLGTLQETEVMVSLDMSTIDSIMKADVSIAEIESVESKSNGQHIQKISSLKSSENNKTTDCKQKISQDKSTPMEKVKENSDTESHPVTGNLEDGSRSTVEPLPNSTMVPSAWVCCDDCHKWRRISAILADSIELTGCRWICKENMDKIFADCSIPQEMSNADINQELELSEASGEEDASNNRVNSNQLVQKQPTDSYPLQLSWKLIKTNMFLHRNRRSQPMDEVMVCHCKPPLDGRLGCRDECLNRMLNIECVKGTCPCGESCSNQKFQKRKYSKIKCVPSGKKGFGLQLQEDIPRGRFLIEYVGEVLDMPAYEARQKEYASKGHKHFYFMTLNGSEVIDACAKGNLGRFINHSCEPNCRTEKWMVNGEVCIGLFAIRDIKKGEELTFDYNYVRVFGAAAKKCVCGSSRCRGVIGGDPLSDETVVLGDSDDEYPESVTFYENPSNRFDNIISGTTSKNNSSEFPVAVDFENVENSQSQSPDSLLVTDEKSDDPVESTETQVSIERDLSEIKLENSERLNTCFKVNNNVKSEIILKDVKDSKKKPKSQTNSKKCTILKPKSQSKLPSSSPLKKWKSKNMQPEMDKKPLIEPQKPKKIVVDNLTGFDAVEEALNSLLNENKGISKRRDASKGYLTLLCLTAYGGNGKGIQSNRDLSMILGALLLTKSRTVLLDIINKNGLQMLHILLKRYKKDFDKTPILRKILKVFEYLAETKILTVETILKPSPHRGESLKESILSLTEHANQQVHQIARSFRDRWIPWSARRVNWAERETERTEYQKNSNFKSFPLQPTNSSDREIKSSEFTDINDTKIPQDSSESRPTDRIRTRKRKSRWDEEPEDINSINFTNSVNSKPEPLQNQTNNEDMDTDAPPGFSTATNRHKTVMGQPQDRFNSRLPIAFGVPCSVLQKLDTKPVSNVSESWVVAPGMKFYPFPPLPVYPPARGRVSGPFHHNQPGFQYRNPNPNTVDRRYFKQQKWNNNNHNSSRSGHPWNPNKYRPAGYNGPKQHYEGDGNGFYQQSHE